MSNRSLQVDIDIENLDLLADALLNAPAAVTAAAEDAGREAIAVLGPSIDAVTNVDTGYLVSNNVVFLAGPLSVMFENITPYAVFVNNRYQFVQRGVANVEFQVEAIYEQAFTDLAENFARGI